MPYNVFISYSWSNIEERKALARAIAAIANVRILVDDNFISPGQSVHSAILSMIDAADCLVVLLTKEGLQSREVLDEITRAHERRKLIIPIIEEGTTLEGLPWYLRDARRILYNPKDFEAIIKSVVAEIGKLVNLFESPHPTTLRMLFGLSCLYWILTGPWPLLWLFISPGQPNCRNWWPTVTSAPHLYLHSTCVGLFLTLCLRYPLGAMFKSSVFRKRMWITLSGLVVLTLLFILYDVKEGPELYGCDPTGFWLPLSSAFQMLAFMLTAAVAILVGLRTVTDPSPYAADRKISNRLFGTILYGLLWLPMRSVYEEVSPEARGLLHSDSFWIVVFVFILGEALLAFNVLYKQRRYVAPLFVMTVSTAVFLVALGYPNVCTHLFGKNAGLYIYLLVCGVGFVSYLGMIPREEKEKA